MNKLLNKSKWFYYTLGLLSALIIISSVFFMSQYKFLRVNYTKETLVAEEYFNDAKQNKSEGTSKDDWVKSLSNKYAFVDKQWFIDIWDLMEENPNAYDRDPETQNLINEVKIKDLTDVVRYDENAKLNGASQSNLFKFIDQVANRAYEKDGSAFKAQEAIDNNSIFSELLKKDDNGDFVNLYSEVHTNGWVTETRFELYQTSLKKVDNVRNSLDTYNNLILAYGIVSLITFALLIVLSNHNRRIYYKENVIGGILLPLVNIIFSIILVINGFSLVSNISNSSNNALYNVVSAIQNPVVGYNNVALALSEETNLEQIKTIINNFNINPTTLLVYISFFVLTIAFNVFLIIFAVAKYNATAKERKEVLDRARMVGDKA